jgi:thioredoxin-dependent peroxiredoxin
MRSLCLAAGLAATAVAAAAAQQPATPSPAPAAPPLEVGAVAPDFAMSGATRYGVLRSPIHLSDFKGKTVVLAFFFKARTRG